jgi:endoglucanase
MPHSVMHQIKTYTLIFSESLFAMNKRISVIFSFCYLLFQMNAVQAQDKDRFSFSHGGIIRGDSTKKEIALVFTGDEFGDGLPFITATLEKQKIKGSFFFTGRFYRNPSFQPYIKKLYKNGNYLGPHSNWHLLYCDWNNRDSLLVTHETFVTDMNQNLATIRGLGIDISKLRYYIPPYEWWNDSITVWSKELDLQVINFTEGIKCNTDYTYPEMGASYKSSDWIIQSLKEFDAAHSTGFNGAMILIHIGTDPRRKDKLYNRLNELISWFRAKGYKFRRVDEVLGLAKGGG